MIAHPTLTEYFETVYRVARPLRDSSIYYHRRSLTVFCDWLGRDPPIGQVDDEMVSAFVRDMADQYAPRTIRRLRANVLSTVRHAARAGLAQMPVQPRSVRVPPSLPEAWTVRQLQQLLQACGSVRHGAYLRGCILTIWDTGLRYADARALTRAEIASGARRQNKTGEPVRIQVRGTTQAALEELPDDPPLRYGGQRHSYEWWRELCQVADVPHGGPQRLRRSAATELERHQPGAATAFLGHRSTDLAYRHYIDPRILQRDPPRPPALG